MAATKTSSSAQPSNPFIKQLASSNRTTRDRALSSLRTYLSATRSTPLSTLDLLKLWKGLFYCMFMSDKPRNQQALARDLAALVDVLPSFQSKLSFVSAFWTTMGTEWGNIDYLRMDKYLYLVRCYVNKGFQVLAEKGWEEEMIGQYNEVLSEESGPLSARDAKVPNGLRLHVLDVWVDELEKVDGDRVAPIEKVLEPVRKLSSEAFAKSVKQRAKESMEDERLEDGAAWKEEEADDQDEDDDNESMDSGFEQETPTNKALAAAKTDRSQGSLAQKGPRQKNR